MPYCVYGTVMRAAPPTDLMVYVRLLGRRTTLEVDMAAPLSLDTLTMTSAAYRNWVQAMVMPTNGSILIWSSVLRIELRLPGMQIWPLPFRGIVSYTNEFVVG